MKYLLAVILLTLSMASIAGQTQEEAIRTKIICEEGYKFLLVWNSSQWRPPNVVQIYKKGSGTGGRPQPIECNE